MTLVAAIPATSAATTDRAAADATAPPRQSTPRPPTHRPPPTRGARPPRRRPTTTTTSTADTTSTTTTTLDNVDHHDDIDDRAPTSTSAPTVVPPSEPVAPAASPGNARPRCRGARRLRRRIAGHRLRRPAVAERHAGWSTVPDATSPALTTNVAGLTNGTTHHFRVRAVNVAGSGPPSAVASVVPRTVPTAPRTLTAAPTNELGPRLSWLAPASNGGAAVTDYVVQRSPNGTSGWMTINDGVSTATAFTVTGLANGTRYYFRVLARNAAGYSASSNVANAVPRTVPTRRAR